MHGATIDTNGKKEALLLLKCFLNVRLVLWP